MSDVGIDEPLQIDEDCPHHDYRPNNSDQWRRQCNGISKTLTRQEQTLGRSEKNF
jgi:hypothetical protein